MKSSQTRMAFGGLITLVLLYTGIKGAIISIIDLKTLFILGSGVSILYMLQHRFGRKKKPNVGQLFIQLSLLNACYHFSQFLQWDDPSRLWGRLWPASFLGVLYGFWGWMLAEIAKSR